MDNKMKHFEEITTLLKDNEEGKISFSTLVVKLNELVESYSLREFIMKEYLIGLCESIKEVKASEGTLNLELDQCKGWKFEITCRKIK